MTTGATSATSAKASRWQGEPFLWAFGALSDPCGYQIAGLGWGPKGSEPVGSLDSGQQAPVAQVTP
jgi:hypothetical protein